MTTNDIAARRAAFRMLHQSGCFVMPNPWDQGSARHLKHLGFPALATTSGGYAFSRALPDTDWAVPRDEMIAHIAEIVSAVGLPVHADFESGYAHDPEGVAESVRRCAAAGVAGLSIEDTTGDSQAPLYDLPLAAQRIRAARAALDASAPDVLLTARAECFLVSHPDALKESIRRLQAYVEAGADVLFAPGVAAPDDIRALVNAVSPKPLNVLVGRNSGMRVADLADLGVRRISVGSALWRAAWGAFVRAAGPLAAEGSFSGFEGAVPFPDVNGFFRADLRARRSS